MNLLCAYFRHAPRPPGPGAFAGRIAWLSRIAALLVTALATGAVLADPIAQGSAGSQEPAGSASFKPTAQQLASLRIAAVARAPFRVEHVTDGKIALDGDRTTPVFSPYSGRVVRVLAGVGDVVHAGQPLLELEASEFVQGQNDLLAAQAATLSAHAQLTLAQTNEQRKHALLEARAGSQQDWQQSLSDLAAAQGAARTAEAALAAVRRRLSILGKTDAQIDALAQASTIDAVATIVAPIEGTVTDRQVGPGQYLQAAASTPVFTVADLRSVWLVANVRESDAPYVRKGQTLEVQVMALPGRTFSAQVSYVAPALDPATRRLSVRARIANAEGLLKPEMFATFSLLAGTGAQALAVPLSGVIYEGAEARVWIARDDGTLVLRKIRPGRTANGLLEVLSGVKAGEKVVASGALFIDRAAEGD